MESWVAWVVDLPDGKGESVSHGYNDWCDVVFADDTPTCGRQLTHSMPSLGFVVKSYGLEESGSTGLLLHCVQILLRKAELSTYKHLTRVYDLFHIF